MTRDDRYGIGGVLLLFAIVAGLAAWLHATYPDPPLDREHLSELERLRAPGFPDADRTPSP